MAITGKSSVGKRVKVAPGVVGLLIVLGGITYAGVHFASAKFRSDAVRRAQVFAKKNVSLTVKYPNSAKYKDVHAYVLPGVNGGPTFYGFCGSVNAKNSLGTYSGYQRFCGNSTFCLVGARN